MNTSMSYAVFLEPKGILKILQFVFVICAFACACDFRGSVNLTVVCSNTTDTNTTVTPTIPNATHTTTSATTSTTTTKKPGPQSLKTFAESLASRISGWSEFDSAALQEENEDLTVKFVADFQYPFNLDKSHSGKTNGCDGGEQVMDLSGNYSSTASFFVFVGVFGMLFTIFAIVVYVFFQPTYEFMEWIPIADTITHAVFTLFWFGASIAWATALTQIKQHTKTDEVVSNNEDICGLENECSVAKIEYQLLDFSVIFGFLNVVLFGGNVWFLFKETKFFKKPVTS